MALASCHVGVVSYRTGRSAIAAAAYRAADKLHNDYDGLTSDYTRKRGVIYSEIMAPENTPEWAYKREPLWNEHQKAQLKRNGELRDDAQLAREIIIALPRELTWQQNIELARDFAKVMVKQGMVVDFSVHNKHRKGNPHVHYLLTMRDINEDGFAKKKNAIWDRKEYLTGWRKAYEDITNRHLEMNGFEERICVDSYAKQGIDQIPTIHLGTAAHHMEQKGIQTDRGDINRGIQEANRRMKEMDEEIAYLEQEAVREEELLQAEEIDNIKHHEKPEAGVRKTEEELENLLAEEGQDMAVQQQGYIEAAAGQLQKPAQEQEAPVTPAEPEQPPGDEGVFHPRPGRTTHHVRRPPETGPPSGPDILRQRKLAQEHEQEQRRKEAGSRSPPHAHASQHSEGRTLANQRRAAQERRQQEQQKPEEGTLRHTPSPRHSEGRVLALQRQAAKERHGQEQKKAEDQKTQQEGQHLHQNHGSGNISQ